MYRLMQRAAELDDTFAKTAEFSLDSSGHLTASFADMVQAIHIVQEEIGITGTTAKEAGATIQGSVGAMKAAWTNLVTGLADENADIKKLVQELVTSIVGDGSGKNLGVLGNILPAVQTALDGIPVALSNLIPKMLQFIPRLTASFLPKMLNSIQDITQAVVDVLPQTISTLISVLRKYLPLFVDAGISIIRALIEGIDDNIQAVVDGAVEIIKVLVKGLVDLLPRIVDTGLEIILTLAEGLVDALPDLLPAIVDIITAIVTKLCSPEMLRKILSAALTLVVALAEGLMNAIPQLIDAVVNIIVGLQTYLLDPDMLAKIINAGVRIVVALAAGVVNAIPQILTAFGRLIKSVIKSILKTDWGKVGKDVINGILGGLKKAWSSLKRWFTNAWNSLFGGKTEEATTRATNKANNKLTSRRNSTTQRTRTAGGRRLINGSHALGLDYVPFDGYIAELHKGERVLTAKEAAESKKAGGVTVVQNIYSQAKSAADLMQEALYQQKKAVLFGV